MWKNLKETSIILGVSVRTMHRWIDAGRLITKKENDDTLPLGYYRVVDEESIMKNLQNNQSKTKKSSISLVA
jgi:predicted site-specific integrase-resolvase